VVQYDFGKTIEEGKFIKTRSLDKPPMVLRSAISKLRATHEIEGSAIGEYVSKMLESKPRMREKFKYQGIKLISCSKPITTIGRAEEAAKAVTRDAY
jgi:hypothetical protein